MRKSLWIVVALLVSAGRADAAISFLSAACATGTANPITVTITINSGDTVVVGVGQDNTGKTNTVADTGGSLYKRQAHFDDGSSQITDLYAVLSAQASTSVSVTNAANSGMVACVARYSGVGGFGTIGTNNSLAGTVTPTVTVTSGAANSFIVAALAEAASAAISAGTSGTLRTSATTTLAGGEGLGIVDNTAATASAIVDNMTLATSQEWAVAAIELSASTQKPPGTGTGACSCPDIFAFTLASLQVTGGSPVTGEVVLSVIPTAATTVTLTSSNTAVATVPASIVIPPNLIAGTFTVTTLPVTASTTVTLTASFGTSSPTVNLVVQPTPAAPIVISSLVLSPAVLVGGAGSTGLVTLHAAAPSGGAIIGLHSSNTAAAQVPVNITIPSGSTTGTFSVTTSSVTAQTTVSITATSANSSATANLVVNAAPAPPPAGMYIPALVTSWQWQLSSVPTTFLAVNMYDIDGFDTPASTVTSLHGQSTKVVCYLSTGTWEQWRPDANQFPASVKGNTVSGFSNEKWLDIRQIATLAPIMQARFDMCKTKGFDAIEADNVDGYTNRTGFPLVYADQIAYNSALAGWAHSRGLSIALKNDVDQVVDLLPKFDFAINEQCNQYSECSKLTPFIAAGKAVFQVEYNLTTGQFCAADNTANFNGLLKTLVLDATRTACR